MRSEIFVLTAVLLLIGGHPSTAHEVCKNSEVPKQELRRYDGAALLLSTDEILAAEAAHVPWGYADREKRLLYHPSLPI